MLHRACSMAAPSSLTRRPGSSQGYSRQHKSGASGDVGESESETLFGEDESEILSEYATPRVDLSQPPPLNGAVNAIDSQRQPISQSRRGSVDAPDTSRDPRSNIKVVVRVRPFNSRELSIQSRRVVEIIDDHMIVLRGRTVARDDFLRAKRRSEKQFTFDRVFGGDSTQQEVYSETIEQLLESVIQGYNATMFAYGATGAGKTYTMLGTSSQPGIMFRAISDLFRKLSEHESETIYEIIVSYCEVYNERIHDLLNPGNSRSNGNNGAKPRRKAVGLRLREDNQRGVFVDGLTEMRVESDSDIYQLLLKGNNNRTTESTDANGHSSRSHAILQINIHAKARSESLSSSVTIGKLSLIDLAGSERATHTNNSGIRMRESKNINKSLLSLKQCIKALARNGRSKGLSHVPYRDSKLTRFLKDSFGNCQTVMIVNISPADFSLEETSNSLFYADSAKSIKTSMSKRVITVEAHISEYKNIIENQMQEISQLKEMLHKQQQQQQQQQQQYHHQNEHIQKQNNSRMVSPVNLSSMNNANDNHRKGKIKGLERDIQLKFEELTEIQIRLNELEKERMELLNGLSSEESTMREGGGEDDDGSGVGGEGFTPMDDKSEEDNQEDKPKEDDNNDDQRGSSEKPTMVLRSSIGSPSFKSSQELVSKSTFNKKSSIDDLNQEAAKLIEKRVDLLKSVERYRNGSSLPSNINYEIEIQELKLEIQEKSRVCESLTGMNEYWKNFAKQHLVETLDKVSRKMDLSDADLIHSDSNLNTTPSINNNHPYQNNHDPLSKLVNKWKQRIKFVEEAYDAPLVDPSRGSSAPSTHRSFRTLTSHNLPMVPDESSVLIDQSDHTNHKTLIDSHHQARPMAKKPSYVSLPHEPHEMGGQSTPQHRPRVRRDRAASKQCRSQSKAKKLGYDWESGNYHRGGSKHRRSKSYHASAITKSTNAALRRAHSRLWKDKKFPVQNHSGLNGGGGESNQFKPHSQYSYQSRKPSQILGLPQHRGDTEMSYSMLKQKRVADQQMFKEVGSRMKVSNNHSRKNHHNPSHHSSTVFDQLVRMNPYPSVTPGSQASHAHGRLRQKQPRRKIAKQGRAIRVKGVSVPGEQPGGGDIETGPKSMRDYTMSNDNQSKSVANHQKNHLRSLKNRQRQIQRAQLQNAYLR